MYICIGSYSKFPADRLVLAPSSDYFAILLGPNFLEGSHSEITLADITGYMLGVVLKFIYSAEVEINNYNISDISDAASKFQLTSLENRCSLFLQANLVPENCVERYSIADKYSLMDLRWKALKIICNSLRIVPVEKIQQFEIDHFEELLAQEDIISARNNRFRSISWMVGSPSKRNWSR